MPNVTTSVTADEETTAQRYLQAITLALLILLGLGLNLIVIITYISSKLLRQSKHNVFIMHLMLCDMVYVLWVMPVSGTEVFCPDGTCFPALREGILCEVTGFLSVFQCTLASLTLATIAVDRYVAVLHPMRYITDFTKARCLGLLTICWLWASLTALPPLLPTKTAHYYFEPGTKHCSPSFRSSCWYFWYAIVMGYGIPLPTMAFCYFKVSRTLRAHKMKIFAASVVRPTSVKEREEVTGVKEISLCPNTAITNAVTVNDGGTPYNDTGIYGKHKPLPAKRSHIRSVDKQIAKRGALLITAYFLCWGPYAVTHACPVHVNTSLWVDVGAMWLVYSLTVINPPHLRLQQQKFQDGAQKDVYKMPQVLIYKIRCHEQHRQTASAWNS
ncbi:probable G-protein coupled receptor 21 [Haliotis rubra]|uniref:probable G-protein coupled receptor 21 n=1 Tax=Haliotis rubra TaxID=36100 RepID=UPI001EE50352|nr:probable G-protein coupled receptor 21 [Haliotis rubra]